MEDTKNLTYICPFAEVLTLENSDIVCTSGGLKSADETLTAASWKQSWTDYMGIGGNN